MSGTVCLKRYKDKYVYENNNTFGDCVDTMYSKIFQLLEYYYNLECR